MAKKYIIRLDDISWDMNYDAFLKMKKILDNYNVKPIIGIIPDNKDEKLKVQACGNAINEERFWTEMRILQRDFGWAVALHGFDHVYVTNESGLMKINKRSEFAGVPYNVQELKIRNGKRILDNQGLKVDAFMAPAHSFDWNTIKALKENDIKVITDGRCIYPRKKRDVVFVPQVGSWPLKKLRGIQTVCLHINLWDNQQFEKFESVLNDILPSITTFQEVVESAERGAYDKYIVQNIVYRKLFIIRNKLSNIKRELLRK